MTFDSDHTFTDKRGRKINFEMSNDITAHADGMQIGSVQFEEEDEHPILFNMEVDPQYQRSGIGTEMIRLAAEVHGRNFGRPKFSAQGGVNKSSTEYFTQEGAALIAHCIEIGIIDDLPESSETFEDDEFEA